MLMALMPEAGYGEILAALFGDLPLVPWHVPFAVPTETVLATWRDAVGPEPVLHLQDMVLGASAAKHEERACQVVCVSRDSRCPFVILLWVVSGVRVRWGRGRGT
jgi:hypothetical protein